MIHIVIRYILKRVYNVQGYIHVKRERLFVQGGEDAYDALKCRSLSAKTPLITGLFCGK